MDFRKHLTAFSPYWPLLLSIAWGLIAFLLDSFVYAVVGAFVLVVFVSAAYSWIRTWVGPHHIVRTLEESVVVATYSMTAAILVFMLFFDFLGRLSPGTEFWSVLPSTGVLVFFMYYLNSLHDVAWDSAHI